LTRVTFPPQMPSNPPHHRSGAALHYILSGTVANTRDGKREARGPGSLVYEPFGLVHQWGNAGDASLTFLAFNIIRKVWRERQRVGNSVLLPQPSRAIEMQQGRGGMGSHKHGVSGRTPRSPRYKLTQTAGP
jgi:uncharacterized RmlC-like cupin family protein